MSVGDYDWRSHLQESLLYQMRRVPAANTEAMFFYVDRIVALEHEKRANEPTVEQADTEQGGV